MSNENSLYENKTPSAPYNPNANPNANPYPTHQSAPQTTQPIYPSLAGFGVGGVGVGSGVGGLGVGSGVMESMSNSQQFRLIEIQKYRTDMEAEMKKYSRMSKKSKKIHKSLLLVNAFSNSAAVVLAGSTTGCLIGGVTIPVAIPLGALAGGLALSSGIMTVLQRFMNKKVTQSHDRLAVVSAVHDKVIRYISKAIEDKYISDEEFQDIKSEYEKRNHGKQGDTDSHQELSAEIEKFLTTMATMKKK